MTNNSRIAPSTWHALCVRDPKDYQAFMLPMVEDFLTAQTQGIAVRDHSLPESKQTRDFVMKCIPLYLSGGYPG